jgi:CelD/BcsL family acetyltransferase involved in cellulose biosynthesis
MLRSVCLNDEEQIRPIWPQWDDLAVLRCSPYCSPAWMIAWWRHVAPAEALLRVVAVFEGEDLVGVAPFFTDRGFGGVRRYRLLGATTSAPLDILARPGVEGAVASETVRHLAKNDPRPDAIMFEGISGDSPWPRLLSELWPGAGKLRLRMQFSQPAPFVDLRGSTYAEWFASRSANFRSNMRRGLKDVQKHGAAVRLTTDRQTLTPDLEAFARLHQLRWSTRGGSGVLDARVERMLADAGAQLIEGGRFRLWSMQSAPGGPAISSQLFLAAGGRVAYWLGGFDADMTRIRKPAILTILAAVEHAFAIGDTLVDLGAGGQRYKYDFSQGTEAIDWILLIPPGRRSLFARAQLARLRVRIALAQRIPPRAKQIIRKALALAARPRHR